MAARRRGFLRALALAPLAPSALASPQTPAPPAPAAPPAAASAGDGVADALAEAVRREHATHLDAAAVAEVRKQIVRSLEHAARLRATARLKNGDAPVTVFSALPPAAAERDRP